jgi:hypothetical protein
MKAYFFKQVPRNKEQPLLAKSQNDECRIYELSEPIEYAPGKETDFVLVAAMNGVITGPETHIYAARFDGSILDWAERPGSFQGGMDCEEAIRRAGWQLVHETVGQRKRRRVMFVARIATAIAIIALLLTGGVAVLIHFLKR